MMKRLFLILLTFHFSLLTFAQMSEIFTSMPDSIFPLLTEKNRKDMVDFYNNKMEAKVRNRFADYVRLDTLTNQYLRLTLSKSGEAVMKLLETTDSMTIIALVQTVTTPVRDSRVRFYDSEWRRLYWLELPVPSTADFFKSPLLSPHDGGENPEQQALPLMGEVERAIDDLRLVEVSVSPEEPVFTLTLSIDELDEEEKKVARRYVVPVRYRWTGNDFVTLP